MVLGIIVCSTEVHYFITSWYTSLSWVKKKLWEHITQSVTQILLKKCAYFPYLWCLKFHSKMFIVKVPLKVDKCFYDNIKTLSISNIKFGWYINLGWTYITFFRLYFILKNVYTCMFSIVSTLCMFVYFYPIKTWNMAMIT